jgi:hypothetical protein
MYVCILSVFMSMTHFELYACICTGMYLSVCSCNVYVCVCVYACMCFVLVLVPQQKQWSHRLRHRNKTDKTSISHRHRNKIDTSDKTSIKSQTQNTEVTFEQTCDKHNFTVERPLKCKTKIAYISWCFRSGFILYHKFKLKCKSSGEKQLGSDEKPGTQ